VIRTQGAPKALVPSLRAAIHELSPAIPGRPGSTRWRAPSRAERPV